MLHSCRRQECPPLQCMLMGCIVIKPRRQESTGIVPEQNVDLGRMQVTARRLMSQRPAIRADRLPDTQSERQLQTLPQYLHAEWCTHPAVILELIQ